MPNNLLFIATLIANPKKPVLTPELADNAIRTIKATHPEWLAEGIACEFLLPEGQDKENAYRILKNIIGSEPIDIVVQQAGYSETGWHDYTKSGIIIEEAPFENRKKKLLLADMDSTMIEQECIDELAEKANLREHVAAITRRAMNGEIAFEPAMRERVSLLRNLPLPVIDHVIEKRITLMPGGRELVQTMRANGAYTALVSGGFTLFTEKVAATIGFDEHSANMLEHDGIRLTGLVREPILGKQAKLEKLMELCAKLNISPAEAMAVGDGANDLAMLQQAGSGVAMHAKPVVAEAASIRIDHSDLTALLYIQGYRKADFVI